MLVAEISSGPPAVFGIVKVTERFAVRSSSGRREITNCGPDQPKSGPAGGMSPSVTVQVASAGIVPAGPGQDSPSARKKLPLSPPPGQLHVQSNSNGVPGT